MPEGPAHGVARRLPPAALRAYRKSSAWTRRVAASSRARLAPRGRRSAAAIFSEVYATNVWGGESGGFYSGGGSDDEFAEPYCAYLNGFLARLDAEPLVLVDLGCGDFRVGRRLLSPRVRYLGIDVVPSLIDFNEQTYGDEGVSFECLDVTQDALPDGDVCLVRQVLQHLSNAEIRDVLGRLEKYSHVLVTEHYFRNDAELIRNLDKPHGPDTRLAKNSGVYLDEAPFNITPIETVLTTPLDEWTELRTIHLERGRLSA
jgi:Methyltransferase domain